MHIVSILKRYNFCKVRIVHIIKVFTLRQLYVSADIDFHIFDWEIVAFETDLNISLSKANNLFNSIE